MATHLTNIVATVAAVRKWAGIEVLRPPYGPRPNDANERVWTDHFYDAAVADFLAQKRIAVAGVSRSGAAAANFVFRKLRTARHDVYPVNPAADMLEGVPCYHNLAAIPGGVTAVVVMTPPQAAEGIVRECARLGITRVWLHRTIGLGSASEAAIRAAGEAKITIIPSGCPAMFCNPDIAHRCFRWLRRRRRFIA